MGKVGWIGVLALLAMGCMDKGSGEESPHKQFHEKTLPEAREEAARLPQLEREQKRLARELEQVDVDISAATQLVTKATSDAAREEAATRLTSLHHRQRDLVLQLARVGARLESARAAAEYVERRKKPVTITKECMDNPLAKGCS